MPPIIVQTPSLADLQWELDEIDSHHSKDENALMVISEIKDRQLNDAQ
jgi:hypothetical protein